MQYSLHGALCLMGETDILQITQMHLITTVTDNTEKSMAVLNWNEKGSVNIIWKRKRSSSKKLH